MPLFAARQAQTTVPCPQCEKPMTIDEKRAQRIIDTITQDKIQSLQTELQSAQLQLSNAAQTNNIINALRPTPTPSYPVMSPYTSIINPTGFTFGAGNCGCAVGCGC